MKKRRAAARIDELLSAYLDGELNPQERDRLEARLAAEPDLRARLEMLRQTVALVQELEPVPAPRNFLLTPQMVASPHHPAERSQRRSTLNRWLAPAMTVATVASALACIVVLMGSMVAGLSLGGMAAGVPPVEEPNREVGMDWATEERLAQASAATPTVAVYGPAAEGGAEPPSAEAPAALPLPEATSSPEVSVAGNTGISETAGLTGELEIGVAPSPTVSAGAPARVAFPTPTPALEEWEMPLAFLTTMRFAVAVLALLTTALAVITVLTWRARKR